ncbi:unnamed protein product [Phaedon cochleariae]|uniref:Protein kinase domain-containing protein n=1 Tax=Phaedon cochleariae TaxID=80249 RepID=A0A9N9X293_PHACE|nr:unnamed protein product [Phaedon cochleariae]
MITSDENSFKLQRTSSLKERDVRHVRIDDVKYLYEIFEFKEEIGHGTFGIVVSAIEKQTNAQYAIKIVNKYSAGAAKLKETQREIKILKSVLHPNIILLEKVFESTKKIYMVFERCRETLFCKYNLFKPFTEKISRKIMRQLVGAVYYLHKHDIVHRDIKMENILLADNIDDPSDEYFIKLTDFGLSIIKSGYGIQSMLSDRVGTIIYMSPEILRSRTYSELCDVWAIGVILFMLLFGRYPFYAKNDEHLVQKICDTEPEYSVSQVNSDCIDLLKSTLLKDPVKRITALEILKHPWLVDNKMKSRKDETIIDYMKKWRSEMMLPGEESDWISAILDINVPEISTLHSPTNINGRVSQTSIGFLSQYSNLTSAVSSIAKPPSVFTLTKDQPKEK